MSGSTAAARLGRRRRPGRRVPPGRAARAAHCCRQGDEEHRAMLPPILQGLALPVICSPMLIASYPELVIAQCKAGVVGAFPALNARPAERLGHWLDQINDELDAFKAHHPNAAVGPVAVN